MVENNRRRILIDLLFIALVSLIPFIWNWGGYIILGHDAGTPISPSEHFLDRLYTWTSRYGLAGSNQSFAVPGFFVHGLEYLLNQIGLPLWLNQVVSFYIYFFLMGVSMYYLARTLFKNVLYLPLFASIFFQVNHFVLQAWFIAERTKFTTYIALPILIAFIYKVTKREGRPWVYGLASAILMTVFNGAGFIPLYGAILLVLPIVVVLLFIKSDDKIQLLLRYLIFFVVALVFWLLLNSYWILPYISYVTSSFGAEVAKSGGVDGVITWLASISENTSFINLFRLEGIQEWYVNPYHTYASYFLNNPLLSIISFIIPIGAFGSILVAKKEDRSKILLLGIVALISMVFMAGSHPPFGWLYILFIKYIPGFIAFRTPFYKFAPALWLVYALLLGYVVNYFFIRYALKTPVFLKKIIIVLAIVLYSFPILGTAFFTYYKDRSTHVKVPEYVINYGKWANSKDFNFRRLLVLPVQNSAYATQSTWGYWSLATVNSLLDTRSYADRTLNNTIEQNDLINEILEGIESNNQVWITKAQDLNIDGVLLQEDIVPYKFEGKLISPQDYLKALRSNPNIHEEKSFGKWHVFRISPTNVPVKTYSGYYKLQINSGLNPSIYNFPLSVPDNTVFLHKDDSSMEKLKIADIIEPKCLHCTLKNTALLTENRDVRLVPGSRLYPFKIKLENIEKKKLHGESAHITYALQLITRRLFEAEKLSTNNAAVPSKILGWNAYKDEVLYLKEHLEKYLQENAFSESANDTLIAVNDTLEIHLTEIKSLLPFINTDDEAVAFEQFYNEIRNMRNLLNSKVTQSESILSKQYVATFTQSGVYDIYLKSASVNISNTDPDQLFTFTFNNKKYDFKVPINTAWTKIASEPLSATTYKALLSENKLVNKLPPNINQQIYKNPRENCSVIPLGNLDKGTYRLGLKIKSPESAVTTFNFVTGKNTDQHYLPYWGAKFAVPQNDYIQITKDIDIETGNDYTYDICQLLVNQGSPLDIKDITLYHITQPQLIFVKLNPNYKYHLPRTITTTQENNTLYSGTISSGDDNIVMLDQLFDSNWVLKNTTTTAHFEANGYANAWIVPSLSSSRQFVLNFAPQDKLELGKKISLASTLVVVILLIAVFFI